MLDRLVFARVMFKLNLNQNILMNNAHSHNRPASSMSPRKFNRAPVYRNRGQVNEMTMIMTDTGWMKRMKGGEEGKVRSFDPVLRRAKEGVNLRADEVARRMISRQIISNSRHMIQSREVLKLVESLITSRGTCFKGTRIPISPPRQVYLMKLINRMPAIDGRAKEALAHPVIEFITNEANMLHKTAVSKVVQNQTRSDAFANAAVNVAIIGQMFEFSVRNPHKLIKNAKEFIAQREAQRRFLLRTENLSAESIKIARVLQRQITETEMEMHEYADSHKVNPDDVKIQPQAFIG